VDPFLFPDLLLGSTVKVYDHGLLYVGFAA
jgi:hypothetical protein